MCSKPYLFVGEYQCQCPPLWNGVSCNMYDEEFAGGIGQPITPAPTTAVPLDKQRELCKANKCQEKAYNNQCDVRLHVFLYLDDYFWYNKKCTFCNNYHLVVYHM